MRKHPARNKTCAGASIYIAAQWGGGYASLRAHQRASFVANTLIHENRRLQFPLDTLVDALIELEDKQGHWPSKATVVGAGIDDSGQGDPVIVLSVHRPGGAEVTERRYSLPLVAAAIVNYCVTLRVPIPRNSTKTIQVLADGVVLILENTVILQSRHEELSTLPAGSVQPLASRAAAEASAAASAPDPEPSGDSPSSGNGAPAGDGASAGDASPSETPSPSQDSPLEDPQPPEAA